MAMIEIKDLYKQYGPITAVDHVSFSVDRGEVLGFLGPNGAGKSTTMKMITGFLAPDGGTVTIDGRDIAKDPVHVKRLIGYLPEGAPAYPDMTPAGFLEFIAQVRGFSGAEKERRVSSTIARVQLDDVVYQPIETLSKGFKRRVGLAQAILHDPQVLVLDEPTDGLDPNQKHEVRGLIKQMAKEKVIILSTHILEEVDAVCTRALIIAGGKLTADGTPRDLEARSPYHNSVSLRVTGAAPNQIKDAFSNMSDIGGIEEEQLENDTTAWRIRPSKGQSIVAKVSDVAQRHGWHVEELHVHRGRLDDVFRQLTYHQQSRT